MSDTIKENNELRLSQLLDSKANEMTKLEYMSMTLLNGLLSNSNWTEYRQIDSEELTTKAVELTKLLIKKINE